MSDDEADAKGAAEADAYAAEFAADDDDDYDAVFARLAANKAAPATATGKRPREEFVPAPWCLIVKLKFDSANKVKKLQSLIEPLAKYIREHEPTTLSYQLLISDKDPLVATVFERYADKEKAFLEIHRSSAEFKVFREALTALNPTIDGHSFYEDDGDGFMAR